MTQPDQAARGRIVRRGDEALGAFREYKPDLVLLDLMLPGTDGIEVCRADARGVSAYRS